ncbi:MAG: glycosyltransferase family 87 protein [Rickettsiales bacterium]
MRLHLTILTLTGFALLALLWHIMAPGIVWGADGLKLSAAQDFMNYWGAPQLASHDINLLFNGHAYERALHALSDLSFQQLRWSYPLHSLFFYAPFASLPYTPALIAWSILGLTAFAAAFWHAAALQHRVVLLAFLLLSPVSLLELATRQNGFFIGAASLIVLLLLDRGRPVAAGILLGCLTIKPQLFLLWPLYLLMTKQWRCITAASLTTIALIALSISVYGLVAWQHYLTYLNSIQWQLLTAGEYNESRKLFHLMMPGVTPALRLLNAPEQLVLILQLAVSMATILLSIRAFRQPLTLAERALILSLGAFLVSPYGFNYDMTLLTAALLLMAATKRLNLYETILGSLIYLLPLLIYILNLIDLPIAPLLLMLLFLAASDSITRTRYRNGEPPTP